MTDPQAFAETMARKYSEIAAKSEALSEIHASPMVKCNPVAGYVVAFRHPPEVTSPFSDFTRRLSQVVPCIRYDAANAHTTLTAIEVPLLGFQPNRDVLDRLSRAVADITAEVRRGVAIDFRTWLATEDSVIVAGYPTSSHFWEAAIQLQRAGEREELPPLRMPWAGHMTAARFTASREGDAVKQLRELVKDGPALGECRPVAIDVGWFHLSGDGFEIHADHSIA
jgi:hypothetical protein